MLKRIVKLLILFFVVATLIGVFTPLLSKWQQMKIKQRAQEEKIRHLKEENKVLRRQIEDLENDPLALEKAMREHLGITKEGETIYRIKKSGKED